MRFTIISKNDEKSKKTRSYITNELEKRGMKEDKIKPIKILCFLIFLFFKIDKIKHNPHIITIDKNIIFINLNNIIEKL